MRTAAGVEDELSLGYRPPYPVKPVHELLGEMLLAAGPRRRESSLSWRSTAHPAERCRYSGWRAPRPSRAMHRRHNTPTPSC